MWRRVVALLLLAPPSGHLAAWAELLPRSSHCNHEFCTCREHCEQKPAAAEDCHRAKRETPLHEMGDACHAGEARELLARKSYLPPRPEARFPLTWSEPETATAGATGADHPQLVRRGDDVFLSWFEKGAGYRLLPLYP